LLDDYDQSFITPADYLSLLRQYTHQHFLSAGHPDIQEDYNPDTGGQIVGLARSHHYNHSTYIDLVLSGLIGVRPRADEILELAPLLPTRSTAGARPIRYFALQKLAYHGHDISVVYDADGSRYRIGRGLFVFVDGKRVSGPGPLARTRIVLPSKPFAASRPTPIPVDLAVNPGVPDGPIASASSSVSPTAIAEAIDGRLWFFPENPNGWSPDPSAKSPISWYSINLRKNRTIGSVELYFFSDGEKYRAPSVFRLQYPAPGGWQDIPNQQRSPQQPVANGENRIVFPALFTKELRIVLTNPPVPASFRLIEVKAFPPE
jgi:hypothetical protein